MTSSCFSEFGWKCCCWDGKEDDVDPLALSSALARTRLRSDIEPLVLHKDDSKQGIKGCVWRRGVGRDEDRKELFLKIWFGYRWDKLEREAIGAFGFSTRYSKVGGGEGGFQFRAFLLREAIIGSFGPLIRWNNLYGRRMGLWRGPRSSLHS